MSGPRARRSSPRLPPTLARRRRPPTPWWRTLRGSVLVVAALGAVAIALTFFESRLLPTRGGPTAWATLGTRDVHSLVFDPADAQHLYFGHHTGLLESHDGGRTWQLTGLAGADAMNVRLVAAATLQIAGHNVYAETTDSGRTWAPVPNDLPGLDLHAFVVDPADPAHAWAYAVGFGLYESTDHGRHWALRQPGDWPVLAVTHIGGALTLVGLSANGLGASSDGGRTWRSLASPAGQLASLAATPDGSVILAGTTSGLESSMDGARSWQPTAFSGIAVTVAIAPSDQRVVALVDDSTRFFRSADGGTTWPGPT